MVLFDPDDGAPVCILHAGEITAIRTAAASAVATDALARPDATTMAVLGYGEQAASHIHAIARVRALTGVRVWGRDPERAAAFAGRLRPHFPFEITAVPGARAAVAGADIVCTVTNAAEPILFGDWLEPGMHLNLVGSSYAGPVEVDDAVVTRSRFIADSREGVLAQGAEFLKAKAAGLITDEHLVAEIGEVLASRVEGRRSSAEITAYKSLGHIVQDLASAWALFTR
ncbi:Delta(1)-pyrroline-2-carboxylate reductase [Caulobacter sp. NIBR1757]|nr:Delta(1)-pyrroline-2-carboxylate reductase [Caulobacter sp. NIBR1757]